VSDFINHHHPWMTFWLIVFALLTLESIFTKGNP
jgi:hypothetical protein